MSATTGRVRRGAIFHAMLFSVAALAAGAQADTEGARTTPFRAALVDALGGEQSALSAFAETRDFARATGLRIEAEQPGAAAATRAARRALARQNEEDADIAAYDARLDAVAGQALVEGGTAAPARARLPEHPAGLSEAMIARIEIGKRDEQWLCLTEALYFEARGESLEGQVAVAEVVLNRVDSPRYPDSICGVVGQGANRRNACQFSYMCDGRAETISDADSFERLGRIARAVIDGQTRDLTDDALFYHNTSVKPRWSSKLVRTARIGSHIFYRDPVELSER